LNLILPGNSVHEQTVVGSERW